MDLHTACKHTASSQTCHKNITEKNWAEPNQKHEHSLSFYQPPSTTAASQLGSYLYFTQKDVPPNSFLPLALVYVGWLLPKYGWPALRTETSLAWTEDIWLWVKTQSHDMSPQLSWAQCVCLLACSMFGTDGVIWELWLSCGWVCARVRFPGSVGNLSPQFTLRTSRSPRQHFSPQKQQR